MKTLSLFLSILPILLLSILSLNSCQKKETDCSEIATEEGWKKFWSALSFEQQSFIKNKIALDSNLEGPPIIKDFKDHTISSNTAISLTGTYYASINYNSTAAKSIYFNLDTLENFLDLAKKNKIDGYCKGKVRGLRIYLAKYPITNNPNDKNQGLETVILRLVCGGVDLEHVVNGQEQYIAYNFGDVCPPLCDYNQDPNIICEGGFYNIAGSPTIFNCRPR